MFFSKFVKDDCQQEVRDYVYYFFIKLVFWLVIGIALVIFTPNLQQLVFFHNEYSETLITFTELFVAFLCFYYACVSFICLLALLTIPVKEEKLTTFEVILLYSVFLFSTINKTIILRLTVFMIYLLQVLSTYVDGPNIRFGLNHLLNEGSIEIGLDFAISMSISIVLFTLLFVSMFFFIKSLLIHVIEVCQFIIIKDKSQMKTPIELRIELQAKLNRLERQRHLRNNR